MPDLSSDEVRPGQAVRAAFRAARTAGPTIWAVASGKGGVGKSVVSSSLAIGLAQTGPRSVAVDLDLGGANLHTLFGCTRARRTLSDFVNGRIDSLADALAVTTVPGVRLLSGARAGLDLASAERAQKQRILSGLASIDATHVVLDLGAGVAAHTLDAFLAADRRLLVVTPEPTAIENAYHFLKAAFFRALRSEAREPAVRAALRSVLDDARQRGATPRELLEAASRRDARVGDRLRAAMRAFEVDLVVNRCNAEDGRTQGESIAAAGRTELGARLRFAGGLADDRSVPAAVAHGVPVMQLFPGSRFATDVHALVASLFASDPASATRAFALSALPTARKNDECRAPTAVPLASAPGRTAFPGRSLRERRESLGLELAALHERTRIRHRHLEAIEAEQFDALPTDVIVREYVRQIAEALDLADPVEHARLFVEKARASRSAAAIVHEVEPAPKATAPRVAVPEVLPAETCAEADRDLPMPKQAPMSCEPPAVRGSAVSAAFARALSRTKSLPVAPLARPSADDLLAGFDYEPEIEAFAPER